MEGPSLNVIIGANLDKLHAEMKKANGVMQGFQDKMGEMAATLGAAFAVERIADFAFEVTKLAGQAEGVRHAFNQLENSNKVLNEMKLATQGTVSEFDLMKAAVQANNFSIPVENLGKLLEFAHQRATATGQSVDYLVQSIVTGIGRKSPLILDNLGISAIALKEKLKGVGTETASVADVAKAVGEIAEEAMKKGGIAAENNATKIEQVAAKWENLKVKIGDATSGLAAFIIKAASISVDILANNGPDPIKALESEIRIYNQMASEGKGSKFLANQLDLVKQAAVEANRDLLILSDGMRKMIFLKPQPVKFVDGTKGGGETKEIIDLTTIEGIEKRIKELRDKQMTAHGQEIQSLEKEVKLLQDKEKYLKEGMNDFQRLINMRQEQGDSKQVQALENRLNKTIQVMADAHKQGKNLADVINKINEAAKNSDKPIITLQHSLETLDKTMQRIASGKGIQTTIAGYDKLQKESAKTNAQIQKDTAEQTAAAQRAGTVIGDEMGRMISGQQNFAQAMGNIAAKMIAEYATKAIAASGAGAAEASGPYAVAAAAAAMAAMAALFGSFGINSGGGGGGASSYVRPSDRAAAQSNAMAGLNIKLDGDFKMQGNTLVSSLRKANYYVAKTGG